MEQKIAHLTLTGANCGVVLCGAQYKDARYDYWHYAYAQLDHPAICPKCLHVVHTVDEDEDEE